MSYLRVKLKKMCKTKRATACNSHDHLLLTKAFCVLLGLFLNIVLLFGTQGTNKKCLNMKVYSVIFPKDFIVNIVHTVIS